MFNWFFFLFHNHLLTKWNSIIWSEPLGRHSLMTVRILFELRALMENSKKNLRVVQAILFLAPLAFNLTLGEDPRVNRLVWCFSLTSDSKNADKHYQEDSLHLWRQLCSNRLLAAANLIVFFNKVRSFFLATSYIVSEYELIFLCLHTHRKTY